MNFTTLPKKILTNGLKDISTTLSQNGPTILTGIGVVGVFTTAFMGIKATPDAIERLERARIVKWDQMEDFNYVPNKEDEDHTPIISFEKGPLTEWERFSAIFPAYIPTIIVGSLTATSVIFANKINLKRQAVLISAYTLADTKAKEWQDKVRELFGEKKHETVHDDIMKDHMDAKPASTQPIIITGGGDVLCYDDFSGRYFRSNADKIKRVAAELSVKLIDDLWVSANDFYWDLGLEQTTMGESFGWGYDDSPINVIFSTHMSDLKEPCLCVAFETAPKKGYYE